MSPLSTSTAAAHRATPLEPEQSSSLEIRFQRIDEVYRIANVLVQQYPEPQRVLIGLTELLVNAVEHGNLEMTYADKSRLGSHERWLAETRRRMDDIRFRDRWVSVHLSRTASEVTVSIQDQGKGFDFTPFLDFEGERVLHTHGRGIAIARHLCFDHLEFRDGGREVRATVFIDNDQHDEANDDRTSSTVSYLPFTEDNREP